MIIGRTIEIQRLRKVYASKEAEFVVLYGRRRVGKTYLIRQFFKDLDCIYFQATGLQKGGLKKQLKHFADAISAVFTNNVPIKLPSTWDEAFFILTQFINKIPASQKIVLFIDELPWMATRRSGLLEALDYYWNHSWSTHANIVLVVCGSSAAWLIKNIIYNKGGLHNRCTCEIKLAPFSLKETHDFLNYKGIKLNKTHVLDIYMALGGIPYYLKYVEPGLSAAQNIQKILFEANGPLKEEFDKLFHSLFANAAVYVELIQLIAKNKEGVSRTFLENEAKLSKGGGRLTNRLKKLIQTNFIKSYVQWEKKKGEYYKVIDEFCLFYMYWLVSVQNKVLMQDHWLKQIQKPIYHVWAGYAFEAVCQKHIFQIIDALKINAAETISAWKTVSNSEQTDGAQIDLLIDRNDDAITLCEIKYTDEPFVIDKKYAAKLNKKIAVFKKVTKTKKQIFLAMVSANGIKHNMYSEELLQGVATLEDLF